MNITLSPDITDWELFVQKHPSGNIFQSPLIYELHSSVKEYHPGVIGVTKNGTVCGILVYNIIAANGLKKNFSSRSIITGGPLAQNNDTQIIGLLLQKYQQIISEKKVIYTQVRNIDDRQFLKDTFLAHDFLYEEHLTVHLDLIKEKESLLKEMHKKRSANIRRVLKKNITLKELTTDDAMKSVILLMNNTYKRIRVPGPPAALFQNAITYLKNHVYVLGAYTGDLLIGARVYLLYKKTIYDWYACSDLAYSHLHPNDLLPWKGMVWAKERGYEVYDFAGAGKPLKKYGVRDYKIKFGGQLKNFGRFYCIHKPVYYQIGKAGVQIFHYLRLPL